MQNSQFLAQQWPLPSRRYLTAPALRGTASSGCSRHAGTSLLLPSEGRPAVAVTITPVPHCSCPQRDGH